MQVQWAARCAATPTWFLGAKVALILAIDQGTTSTRAIIFDQSGAPVSTVGREFSQIYPRPGLVEHDPEEIWTATVDVCRQALAQVDASAVRAIGITNQRETTIIWDRATGKPIHNAIVWQDRRTADKCAALKEAGHEELITGRTGLVVDPYFSGTKVAWLLDNTPGARERARAGELAFGTVDSFLLWRLTGGRVHATDATNASRTLLYDIHKGDWDDDLLALLDIPRRLLPEVKDNAADFGVADADILGVALPIAGMAGDQHAATVGQACFAPGMVKSTYGTGCFAVLNTGTQAVRSQNRMLTTIAYQLDGQPIYALEGSIFVAGAAVKWLRDSLKVIQAAPDTETLARGLESNAGVYVVPAFTGLGAPYWDPHARGAVFGLTLDAGPAELARAVLEAICYQTRDLADAMVADMGQGDGDVSLRVDGGMVVNDWLMQYLADILDVQVDRPVVTETTALGAAYLAGLQTGIYGSTDEIARNWQCEATFKPQMAVDQRDEALRGWQRAVAAVRGL